MSSKKLTPKTVVKTSTPNNTKIATKGNVATSRGSVATSRGSVATSRGSVATSRGSIATTRKVTSE